MLGLSSGIGYDVSVDEISIRLWGVYDDKENEMRMGNCC